MICYVSNTSQKPHMLIAQFLIQAVLQTTDHMQSSSKKSWLCSCGTYMYCPTLSPTVPNNLPILAIHSPISQSGGQVIVNGLDSMSITQFTQQPLSAVMTQFKANAVSRLLQEFNTLIYSYLLLILPLACYINKRLAYSVLLTF